MTRAWDLVVVGAGPAGASAAIGALRAEPGLTVLLVDRADFPRDKPCGDGIAPHVFDLLEDHGVNGLFDDWAPIPRLRLVKGALTASRLMQRPAKVVPRAVFDDRLRRAAIDAGAMPMRSRVRHVTVESDRVRVDAALDARVLVGADGAHSQVARHSRSLTAGVPARTRAAPGRTAFALRGYAATSSSYAGEQVIVFGDSRQPSYAWAFDRGDGLANVGYGELLAGPHAAPTRTLMRKQLDQLLPGSTSRGHDWRGHHLPLAPGRWRPADGRVLLAGDAARLVNPLTGEGIYYAVLTGLLAGAAAAAALRDGDPQAAGALYRRLVTAALRRHLASTGIAARVAGGGPLLDAGLRAAARDQQVFDDLVDLGLAEGALTPRLLVGLASGLVRPRMCTADVDKGAW